jgi:hypothetical protein
MTNQFEPTFSLNVGLVVGKLEFAVTDRSFDRTRRLLHGIRAANAIFILR